MGPQLRKGARMRPSHSREALCRAYLELVEEMPARRITVSALVERAGVNRSTFYRRYQTLDDVFDDVMLSLDEETLGVWSPDVRSGVPRDDDLQSLLELHKQHADTLRTILNSELAPRYADHVSRIVTDRLHDIRGTQGPDPMGHDLLVSFLAAGTTQLICDWTRDGCTEDVEVVVGLLRAAIERVRDGA